MVSARRQLQLYHGILHQRPPRVIQLAVAPPLGRAHFGVAGDRRSILWRSIQTSAVRKPVFLADWPGRSVRLQHLDLHRPVVHKQRREPDLVVLGIDPRAIRD
jgi:hypothetical protein